jgi:hypothetical protein
MVAGVQTSLFELLVIGFGLWGEAEESAEELVIASFFSLFEQRFGVIGMFKVAVAILASRVAGDKLMVVVEAESIGIELEGEGLPG